jgi:hypothetical protein
MALFNHPSLGTPASTIHQSDYFALTTHPVIELGPLRKRRRLEYVKCDFCRRAKKKVSVLHVCGPSTHDVTYDSFFARPLALGGFTLTQRDLTARRLRRRIEVSLMRLVSTITHC